MNDLSFFLSFQVIENHFFNSLKRVFFLKDKSHQLLVCFSRIWIFIILSYENSPLFLTSIILSIKFSFSAPPPSLPLNISVFRKGAVCTPPPSFESSQYGPLGSGKYNDTFYFNKYENSRLLSPSIYPPHLSCPLSRAQQIVCSCVSMYACLFKVRLLLL